MKPGLCLLLAVLVLSLGMACGVEGQSNRVDLIGVTKSKDGQPIAGASAFIYTAGPKLGVGFL
jgi:hypothetical protein